MQDKPVTLKILGAEAQVKEAFKVVKTAFPFVVQTSRIIPESDGSRVHLWASIFLKDDPK